MQTHQLQKSKWLKDKQRRRGRGNGTGTGNYSGKGLKGQKSRSWHSMKPFFEGGQTSIVQRLPKARGFTRYYKLVKDVVIVNLGALDADPRITDAMEITKQVLKDLWYIKSAKAFVKLLSSGDYAKHLTFKDIDAFSAGAKIKMENPGTVHSASRKAPIAVVKDKKSKVWKLKIKTSDEKKAIKKVVASKVATAKAAKAVKAKKVVKVVVKKDKIDKSPKSGVKKTMEKTAAKRAIAKKTK